VKFGQKLQSEISKTTTLIHQTATLDKKTPALIYLVSKGFFNYIYLRVKMQIFISKWDFRNSKP
jgi:hypothetical protein